MDKFNDYNKLLDSYNNLEKEFTKKCQELSQLKSGTSEVSPPQQTSQQFFSQYPDAEIFREDIERGVTNPEYSEKPDAYSRAYFDLLRKNYVSKDSLAKDDDFLQQYVLADEKTVAKLLQKVSPTVTPLPTVISGNAGSMSVSLPTRPKTIAEASKLAQELFK